MGEEEGDQGRVGREVKESGGDTTTWVFRSNRGSRADHDPLTVGGEGLAVGREGFDQAGRSSRAGLLTGSEADELDANGSQASRVVAVDRELLSFRSSSFTTEASSIF